jgi:hypothetical protein
MCTQLCICASSRLQSRPCPAAVHVPGVCMYDICAHNYVYVLLLGFSLAHALLQYTFLVYVCMYMCTQLCICASSRLRSRPCPAAVHLPGVCMYVYVHTTMYMCFFSASVWPMPFCSTPSWCMYVCICAHNYVYVLLLGFSLAHALLQYTFLVYVCMYMCTKMCTCLYGYVHYNAKRFVEALHYNAERFVEALFEHTLLVHMYVCIYVWIYT